RLPEMHAAVRRNREDAAAVRAKEGLGHGFVVIHRLPDVVAGGSVPDAHFLVRANGEDVAATGAEESERHRLQMFQGLTDLLARGHVPETHGPPGLVTADRANDREESGAVRTEGGRLNGVFVLQRSTNQFIRIRIVNLRGSSRDADRLAAIRAEPHWL